jgi:hypothetical protein
MAEALATHPSVFVSSPKEPHAFGSDLPDLRVWTSPTPAPDYVRLFAGAGPEQVVAEASVWSMRSVRAAREIQAFEPDARIIIMLREPVDLLASLHGELCRAGIEDILDLREALAAERDRRVGHRISRGVPNHGQLLYSDAVAFSEQIERYLESFGRDAVHIVLFDDIVDRPDVIMDGVQRFLGLMPRPGISLDRRNEGRVVRDAYLQRFARQPGVMRSLSRRFVPPAVRPTVARAVVRTIERVNIAPIARPPVPEDLRAELRERFADRTSALSSLIDRDLSAWMSSPRPTIQPSKV